MDADKILGGVLMVGALHGLFRGLVRGLISLLSLFVGNSVANQYNEVIAAQITAVLGDIAAPLRDATVSKVVAFTITVLVLLLIGHFVGILMQRMMRPLFPGPIDAIGGLIVGLVLAGVSIEVVLLLLQSFSQPTLDALLSGSVLARLVWEKTPTLFALWDGMPGADLLGGSAR